MLLRAEQVWRVGTRFCSEFTHVTFCSKIFSIRLQFECSSNQQGSWHVLVTSREVPKE